MKTCHQIIEQYRRLDTTNNRLVVDARRKAMDAKNAKERAKYDALREHYANRSLLLRSCYYAVLHQYGARCRAAGMKWDYDLEEYV